MGAGDNMPPAGAKLHGALPVLMSIVCEEPSTHLQHGTSTTLGLGR
jgi:hypothetical protein